MTNDEKERKINLITEFRYGVIAELTNPYLHHGEIRRLIKEKAAREYDIPYSARKRISADCIRDWLYKFRKYGRSGLKPKIRNDFGTSRCLTKQEQDAFITFLESNPYLTARAVIKKLQDEGTIRSEISMSSLSRLVLASGLERTKRISKQAQEDTRKFDFFYPLECVQADCLHGPMIPDSQGKKRKAILIAFIDDATRRILYAQFSFSEQSISFEDGSKHILAAHGRIGRVYVDNGSTFVSAQTQRIFNTMSILIIHSRPGIPKGRGKVERLFRTLRDGFLRPLDITSVKGLGDLNARLASWIETEYHRTPHRGLSGKTPIDAWLEKTKYIVHLDPTIDLDMVYMHETTRKVYKDRTFTLNGKLYEAPVSLIGKKISVMYDPHPPVKKVFTYLHGNMVGEARLVDTYANTRVKRNSATHLISPKENGIELSAPDERSFPRGPVALNKIITGEEK
jgi:putative transposase